MDSKNKFSSDSADYTELIKRELPYYKIPVENINLSKVELKPPDKKKITSNHTLIVSSVQRNYSLYPNSNKYLVELAQPYRNVEKIELVAVMLPKTEYNINTNNNIIKININNGDYVYLSLTPGQYIIGTNVLGEDYSSNGSPFISGLIAELLTQLNTIGNFKICLVTAPPPNGTGPYASLLNRILIQNTDSNDFSIDFTVNNSAYEILGFTKTVYYSGNNDIYGLTDGSCTPADLVNSPVSITNSLLSLHDYNLNDYPNYIILDLSIGRNSMNRNESIDKSINNSFCIILYDANDPDNIETINVTKTDSSSIKCKVGRKVGNLKSLKGTDFDKKIIIFDPPIIIENLDITFSKYNNELYDFHNREHILTFDVITADFDPRYKY